MNNRLRSRLGVVGRTRVFIAEVRAAAWVVYLTSQRPKQVRDDLA